VGKIITPVLPGGSTCPLILRGRFRWVWSHNWEFKKEVKKLEMRILNYEFSFCLFFFAGVDIRLFNCSSSAFQAVSGCCIFVRRSWPAVMKGIAFQAKVSRWVENFFGLKSRIFITAEFSLRHQSLSETCLEGRTFIYHEGAKTRSWLRPQNIITPALPGGSACPLILRGLFRWV